MHIFDELKERGLIFQTTDEDALRKAQLLIVCTLGTLLQS